MKRSKGFTLVELMTAMAVYGIFLAMLAGAFYALLTFGNRSQQVLIAREHGQRVINYVDGKIRNAGLGLHALQSSEEIRKALDPLTKSGGLLYKSPKLKLPVAVMYNYTTDNSIQKNERAIAQLSKSVKKSEKAEDTEENQNIFIGNILILLYAERNTNSNVNLVIQIDPEAGLDLQSRDVTTSLADGLGFMFLNSKDMTYGLTKFAYKSSIKDHDIRNWTVLQGSGVPFATQKYLEHGIKLMTYKDAKVYAGDELLYLKCETIYADDPYSTDGDTVRNLKVQKLENKEDPEKWGDVDPFESGILEIYAELDTNPGKNILTLWVLSTGGRDTVIHERPKDWPLTARPTNWDDKSNKYKYEILYVSKASWKLNNLAEDFSWN